MGVGCLLPNWPAPSLAPLFQAVLWEIQDATAKAGQVVRESVGGLQTVRSFGAEEQEVCRYKEALERCRRLWWRRDLERALYLLLRRVRKLRAGGGAQVGAGLGGPWGSRCFCQCLLFQVSLLCWEVGDERFVSPQFFQGTYSPVFNPLCAQSTKYLNKEKSAFVHSLFCVKHPSIYSFIRHLAPTSSKFILLIIVTESSECSITGVFVSDGMSRHRGREAKEWKVLRLSFLLPPDAALGNEGALAELCVAADPGRGPHPRWAPLLPALPGGRG